MKHDAAYAGVSCWRCAGQMSTWTSGSYTFARTCSGYRGRDRLRKSKNGPLASHRSAACAIDQGAEDAPRPTSSGSLGTRTTLDRNRPRLYVDCRHRHRAAESEPALRRTDRSGRCAKDQVSRPAPHLRLAPPRPGRTRSGVMDVLDHSQIAITMDLYSHVMPSALREAADAIDRALGQGE